MSDSLIHSEEGSSPVQETFYGEEYFKERFGPVPYERNTHWLNFFGGIADEIVRCYRPKTVFDAGCAWGFLVESLRDRGVDARGVDLSPYAISKVRQDIQPYCTVASLTQPIEGGPYDLVTCIEVVEHMDEDKARQAVIEMTRVTDRILFSSSPDDFDEPTHVNVQSVLYWLKLFAEFRFYPDLLFDASFISAHALVVQKRAESVPEDVLVLFSEMIRMRKYREAFLLRHSRIEQLESEAQNLKRQLEESSERLGSLLAQNRNLSEVTSVLFGERELWKQREDDLITLEKELDDTSQRLASVEQGLEKARQSASTLEQAANHLRDEEARWRAQAIAAEVAHQQSAQLASNLQYQLEDSKLQTSRVEAIEEEWVAHCSELSLSLEQLSNRHRMLHAELETLRGSRSWRLIQRYRDWMQANRYRRPWVRKVWEPAVKLVAQRISTGGMTATPVQLFDAPAISPAIRSALISQNIPIVTPEPKTSVTVQGVSDYEIWIKENEPNGVELEIQRRMSRCFSYRPRISVLVPVYKVPPAVLREAVESVVAQTYDNWELCISIAGNDNPKGRDYLKAAATNDPRIKVKTLDVNEGISGNSNQALSLATGEYVALLDHDDTLAPFALFEVAQVLNHDRSINFIYSDKDQLTEDGSRRISPLFKPEWSPEIMLNANYPTHLCVLRTDQVRQIGGWQTQTDGAQDWDLFLRFADRFGNIRHIPKVLYHWRQLSTSVASGGIGAKPYAAEAQVIAVKAHCDAIGLNPANVYHSETGLRIEWRVAQDEKVSIIFLSQKNVEDSFSRAVELAAKTEHPNFEILVPLPREASHSGNVRCVTIPAESSLIDRIDAAVRAASGQVLVFFDEHVFPTEPNWLREITGPLQLEGVGIVGARFVDLNTRALRHCGLVFTLDGRLENIYGAHPEHVSEQAGSASWYRNWSAVSGACFSVRRKIWESLGGMSGEILHQRLDIHLCLRLRFQTDLRIVYNPYARFLQTHDSALESSVWCDGRRAMHYVRACFPDGDPYFSRNLDCQGGKVVFKQRENDFRRSGVTDYSAESRDLVQIHDFAPADVERSRNINSRSATGRLDSVAWFLPDFSNPFYGGVHTILRFADTFQREYNVRSSVCVIGDVPASRVRRRVAAAFPDLAASAQFVSLDGRTDDGKLSGVDAVVCSLWSTAFVALQSGKATRKFYFIQDDEALFYPAGSTSALVEASYRFGFYGICNTVSILNKYTARGGSGEYFDPCIDTTVFHDRDRKPLDKKLPYTLFCYIRPNHPRNCFELLTATLRILKQRMGDQLLAIAAGDNWDPREYGLNGIVQNLGLLDYQATAALYRMCDAGVVMMMTRHPSYLPMELMGCGSLVITNRNPDTEWLLSDGVNCLLADLSPSGLADRIEEGLKDIATRRNITANARALVQDNYSRWDEQIEKIYRYMRSIC